MALADDFHAIVDSLPPDWTHLQFDLRITTVAAWIVAALIIALNLFLVVQTVA